MGLYEQITKILNQNPDLSDILVQQGEPIIVNTSRGWKIAGNGDIEDDDDYSPSIDTIEEFLDKVDPNWSACLEAGAFNRPLELHTVRLRINVFLAQAGKQVKVQIRPIPRKIPTIAETGLPIGVKLLLESKAGLILLAGATGQGKSTSMAAMLDEINTIRNDHIISLEDPIEYVFHSKKSFFSQREIGVDCESFATGLKDAMRQSPNVIAIGEIADKETAAQAILAGESGHLVFGTLHSDSASSAISKILGYFNQDERESRKQALAQCLIGVVHQTLLPRKAGTGRVLAVDFISNYKRDYSKLVGDPSKITSAIENSNDVISVPIKKSLTKLINDGVVDISDVSRVATGNLALYDALKAIKD